MQGLSDYSKVKQTIVQLLGQFNKCHVPAADFMRSVKRQFVLGAMSHRNENFGFIHHVSAAFQLQRDLILFSVCLNVSLKYSMCNEPWLCFHLCTLSLAQSHFPQAPCEYALVKTRRKEGKKTEQQCWMQDQDHRVKTNPFFIFYFTDLMKCGKRNCFQPS